MKINILQYSGITKILLLIAMAALVISCNKDLPKATPIVYPPANNVATTIGAAISSDTSYSFFKAALTKAGLLAALSDSTKLFTVFLPNNDAFRATAAATGIPFFGSIAGINALPVTTLVPLIRYLIIPGVQYTSSDVPTSFPNIQLPSYLTIGIIPGTPLNLNLSTFPSVRTGTAGGFWDNNIPVISPDNKFQNGVIHLVPLLVAPPQRAMWERINTDADLTILKAAIQRADSGIAPTGPPSLIWALSNFGPNLTVFAPTNQAFKYAINYLTGGAIPVGSPDSVFIVFIDSTINPQTVKGIVVYHVLGSLAFLNNLPTTPGLFPTLLNSAIPSHPGITLECTFSPYGVIAATCKGAINPTASNVLINPTPDQNPSYGATPPQPFAYPGTSDQFYINGTLHKIDQVLLPL